MSLQADISNLLSQEIDSQFIVSSHNVIILEYSRCIRSNILLCACLMTYMSSRVDKSNIFIDLSVE